MVNDRPLIGVTLGDPSGIGPEIIVKALAADRVYAEVRPLVIGSGAIVQREITRLGLSATLNAVTDPAEGEYRPGIIDLCDVDNVPPGSPYGEVSAANGRACYEYIEKSVELALAGKIDGVATAPINKQSIHMAGVPYIGHTEIFAGLTHAPYATVMFHVNKMRIFFLTRHMSLGKAVAYVTREHVLTALEQCDAAMTLVGCPHARIVVAALNPHGSDNGLYGDEEKNPTDPGDPGCRGEGNQCLRTRPRRFRFSAVRTR